MRLLLDTHVLVWSVFSPDRLGLAQALIVDPRNEILFSAASLWEVAIKAGLGRSNFTIRPEGVRSGALQIGFTELPIFARDALRVTTLPALHKDPFDHLLVAQSLEASAKLLTADRMLLRYSDQVVPITSTH